MVFDFEAFELDMDNLPRGNTPRPLKSPSPSLIRLIAMEKPPPPPQFRNDFQGDVRGMYCIPYARTYKTVDEHGRGDDNWASNTEIDFIKRPPSAFHTGTKAELSGVFGCNNNDRYPAGDTLGNEYGYSSSAASAATFIRPPTKFSSFSTVSDSTISDSTTASDSICKVHYPFPVLMASKTTSTSEFPLILDPLMTLTSQCHLTYEEQRKLERRTLRKYQAQLKSSLRKLNRFLDRDERETMIDSNAKEAPGPKNTGFSQSMNSQNPITWEQAPPCASNTRSGVRGPTTNSSVYQDPDRYSDVKSTEELKSAIRKIATPCPRNMRGGRYPKDDFVCDDFEEWALRYPPNEECEHYERGVTRRLHTRCAHTRGGRMNPCRNPRSNESNLPMDYGYGYGQYSTESRSNYVNHHTASRKLRCPEVPEYKNKSGLGRREPWDPSTRARKSSPVTSFYRNRKNTSPPPKIPDPSFKYVHRSKLNPVWRP